jgi:diacylglycerol kinase (ATP)
MLFYNPHSGQRRGTQASVERAAAVLREAGVEADVVATRSAAEAGQQAKDAVAQGYDTIFACGGDGTILDVAQGLVAQPGSAALAILPLGTANVLAHDLGIPLDTVAAAHAVLRAIPLRVSVGKIDYQSDEGVPSTRYFLSVAGAGQDGYLFHQLASGHKRSFGAAAYSLKAFHVWLTHRMEWFSASRSSGSAENVAPPERITQLLAVRLRNFGGVLRDLASGASLANTDLRVVLFKTSSRWSYLLYVLRGVVGARWAVPGVELCSATRIVCATSESGVPVYIEADGELLGQLPAEISIVQDALTLLVSRDFASRQAG